jgi:hypothetical protein
MLRTLSSLFLTGVMIAGGTLAATADMNAPANGSISRVTAASPMTATQTASVKAAPARAAALPKATGTHAITNAMIRGAGGIAPCKYEDGSRQALPCYWNAKVRGNGKGDSFIAMPNGKGNDPAYIYLTGAKAKRY